MTEKTSNPIKEEFRKYLSKKLKSASRYMAVLDNRVREYIRRLVAPEADSIFDYTTTEDVIKCINILEDSDEFNIANERSRGLMQAALQQYLSFICIHEMENKDVARPNKLKDTDLSFKQESEVFSTGNLVAYCEMPTTLILPKMRPMPIKFNPGIISYLPKMFKKRASNHTVYSSIFSRAEVKRDSQLLVNVFLHLQDETETAITMAEETDSFATRRGYRPLPCKLSEGDNVDIQLSIIGKTRLFIEQKTIKWLGSIINCSFVYDVPKELDTNSLCCSVVINANGASIGEMTFITDIVEQPIARNPKVITQPYERIFISYAHQDEETVRNYAKAYQLINRDVFFDRDYLKAGDVFSQEIEKYIKTADLFILFWSENAAKSEHVQKEMDLALPRAFPQIKPYEKAKLRFSPVNIKPKAEPPTKLKGIYHFEEVS